MRVKTKKQRIARYVRWIYICYGVIVVDAWEMLRSFWRHDLIFAAAYLASALVWVVVQEVVTYNYNKLKYEVS